ncbi:MAG: glycosyltransferase family 2 protein [Gaiellales bacterium]
MATGNSDLAHGDAIEATIVLCTRNRASVLPKALETLASQVTNRAFEIVVVDNGSEDETADVIAEWCRRDARFRTVKEPRVGLSRAKNAGVKTARGRIVLFTDDDVLVGPNWVDAHLSLLVGRQDLMIAGGPILPISQDLAPWPDWLGEASLLDLPLLDHGAVARPLGRWEQVWGANMAVPLAVFERIGLWDEGLGRKGDERGTWEDIEFADRLRNVGGEVWFCPGAVIWHRITPQRALPRRMLRAAFLRGLDDYVKRVWASDEPGGAAISLFKRAEALLALWVHISIWLWWSLLFRFFRQRRMFDAARDAAWSAGSRMMELTLRRTPGSRVPVEPPFLFNNRSTIARAIMQMCFLARRVALRLAPPR